MRLKGAVMGNGRFGSTGGRWQRFGNAPGGAPTEREAMLREALQPTPSCISVDRFGTVLSDDESRHLQDCPCCQADLALFTEFQEATPASGEGAAVQWIAAETRRRRSHGSASSDSRFVHRWGWLSLRPMASLAATLAVVAGLSYAVWDREPELSPRTAHPVYRAVQLEVVSPSGDVERAPEDLEWKPVAGAVRYVLAVEEVDGTVLWQTDATATRVEVPREIASRLAPGKTVFWKVTAFDAAGTVIADSGTQRLRVALPATGR